MYVILFHITQNGCFESESVLNWDSWELLPVLDGRWRDGLELLKGMVT